MGDGGHRAVVMVVDDDAGCREALVTLLELEGVETCTAANGREALARLRRREVCPAAIVLDLEMPVMSGWEFRREQLCDPALRDIPVLVASGSDPGAIPADGFLRKPYDLGVLLEAIAEVISPSGVADERSATRDPLTPPRSGKPTRGAATPRTGSPRSPTASRR